MVPVNVGAAGTVAEGTEVMEPVEAETIAAVVESASPADVMAGKVEWRREMGDGRGSDTK